MTCALALAALFAGSVLACAGATAPTPSPPTAKSAPPPATLTDASGPDGAPVGLPPVRALAHLDDGVPMVAGTGRGPSSRGRFGELGPIADSRSLCLLAQGHTAVVRRGYDAIALVSLPDGRERWRRTVDYFDHGRASPDGSKIALVVDSSTLMLADAADGRVQTLGSGMREMAFSPNGERLAASGPERGVTLFDVPTAREVARIEWPGDAPVGLAFAPNGKRLAAWSGSTVRVVELDRKRTVYLAEHGRATAFAWLDDRQLVVGSEAGELAVADVDAEPRPAAPAPLMRLAAPVESLALVPGSARVLADLSATFASLVDVTSGKEIARLQKVRDGRVELSPDGGTAVATGGELATYDLATLRSSRAAAAHLSAASALGTRAGRLVTGGDDGAVITWDASTRKPLARKLGLDPVQSVDLAPESAPGTMSGAVAIGTSRGDILVYDRDLGARLLTFSLGEPDEYAAVTVAFAPDGRQLAAAGGERALLVDLATGQVVAAYRSSFRAARFTPELLVVGPSPVRVLRRRDGAELRRSDDRGAPDGFALGILDGRVAVSAESGEYRNAIGALGVRARQEHGESARFELGEPLAFSPDATRLASVDDEIRFLATADGHELGRAARLPSQEPERPLDVRSVAFADDGRSLFVGYDRGVVDAVAVPASPHPGAELVPGLARRTLGLLVDLDSTATAVGPREIPTPPITLPTETVELPQRAVALARHGSTLLLADADGDLFVYDRRTRRQGEPFFGGARAEPGPAGLFFVTARYDDPPTILGGPEPLTVDKECSKAYPVEPGTYLCINYREVSLRGARSALFRDKHDSVREVAVSDAGAIIALATDAAVLLLAGRDLAPRGRITVSGATHLSLSADGRTVAFASHGVGLVADATTAQIERLFEGDPVAEVLLSADGRRIATCGEQRVRLWDVATGRVVALFDPGESPGAMALSPTGDALLVAAGRELTEWRVPAAR